MGVALYQQLEAAAAKALNLERENAKLRAALEQLIKDFEAVAGSEATVARATLKQEEVTWRGWRGMAALNEKTK